MNTIPEFKLAELEQAFLNPFIEKLGRDISDQQELLRKTEEIYRTFHSKLKRLDGDKEIPKYINETDWLKTTLYGVLEDEFPEKREILFEEEFAAFYESAVNFIEKQEKVITAEQAEERFTVQPNDSFGLKLKKPIKKLTFNLSKLPLRFANLFRKEKKEIKRWNHKIPLQNLLTYYFINDFVNKSLPYFKELQQLKCDALNLKWSIDRDINVEVGLFIEGKENAAQELLDHINTIAERNKIEENINNLDRKLNEWKEKARANLIQIHQEFEKAVKKVDTIELSRSEFTEDRIANGKRMYQKDHLRLFNGWRNTLFAQLDDFQVDIELYHIKYSSLLQFFLLQSSCRLRVKKTIEDNIYRISSEFDRVVEEMQSLNSSKEIEKLLRTERTKVSQKLEKETIPQAIEALYNQNIPYLLDRLEQKVKEQVDKMKNKRIIYSSNDYSAPINKNELSHFNPKELVQIDIFNRFSEENKKLKTEVVRLLEKLQINLKDLSSIVDYNLDSAINSVKDRENQEDIRSIALEGVERTRAKVENLEEELQGLQKLINENLRKAIDKMNESLVELTDNENITELRLQLAKAKAVETTNIFKRNLIKNVRELVPLAYRYIRGKYYKLTEISTKLLKKSGLFSHDEGITAELSDFLNQAEEAIQKLPYVYRRLYRIQPLEEEVFFEGRSKELKRLEEAYQNWEEGNYSTCSLIGEKGSGASSIFNFFLKDLPKKKVIRHKLSQAYSSEDDFIAFFRKLLKKQDLETLEDVAEAINKGTVKVIALEDLQHFYLKKINGFDALNLLFDLISKTAKSTFWVIEITSYTWDYLQKTINIGRYFKYTIKLDPLSEEQIVKLIMKRHRVSGYNLRFKPINLSKVEQRKLKRLNEEETQEQLKNSFFKSLNQFAQSNISLALLYWVRSTQEVINNTIVIGKLDNMKFNFLGQLSQQYIFTLHSLLLHDSLDLKEHAQLFHQSEHQSRMTLMVLEDNGIVKSENGRFRINRLLYRQTVNELRKKNILH